MSLRWFWVTTSLRLGIPAAAVTLFLFGISLGSRAGQLLVLLSIALGVASLSLSLWVRSRVIDAAHESATSFDEQIDPARGARRSTIARHWYLGVLCILSAVIAILGNGFEQECAVVATASLFIAIVVLEIASRRGERHGANRERAGDGRLNA